MWRRVVGTMLVVGVAAIVTACAGDDGDALVADDEVAATVTPTSPSPTDTNGTNGTADTTSAPTSTVAVTTSAPSATTASDASPVTPSGFASVAATITTAAGEVCDLCVWLADSSRGRSQGLMGVTDLGDGDGMAFVYPSPHTGSFWMKNTLLPLSIAFFDDRGVYLDAFDMEPCTADPCPLYPTAPEFTVAIEVAQGDLPTFGIGPGSRLRLTDLPCA